MKAIVLFSLLVFSLYINAQSKIWYGKTSEIKNSLVLSINGNYSRPYKSSSVENMSLIFQIGYQREFNWGSMLFLVDYSQSKYGKSWNYDFTTNYLGGTVRFIGLKQHFRFRPFIAISLNYQVNNSNKNRLMVYGANYYLDDDYGVVDMISLGQSGGGPYKIIYKAGFYQSTPLVLSSIIGCDIRIIPCLHLQLGIGYGMREMKKKNVTWVQYINDPYGIYQYKNEDMITKRDAAPVVKYRYHYIDFTAGLSYSIPLKKKAKQ